MKSLRAGLVLMLLTSLVCGCTHMVAGSESLPASERAVLKPSGFFFVVHLIDGEHPRRFIRRFELPAGKHNLSVILGITL
jgi:hypothetical protein